MMKNADMPAYPSLMKVGEVEKSEGGLSKREYFSAMAMQGMLGLAARNTSEAFAKNSVVLADALLAELEKTS